MLSVTKHLLQYACSICISKKIFHFVQNDKKERCHPVEGRPARGPIRYTSTGSS
jgi:hypothetical protein